MSAFPVPPSWVNGGLSAANLNTVSGGINWLKAAIDKITGTTASDTGTATKLDITRTATSDVVLAGRVNGDAFDRIQILANGQIRIGSGASAPSSYIGFGSTAGDISLTAGSGAQQLSLDRLHINGGATGGYIEWVERDTPPGTPTGVNQGVMYFEDNGSGKSRLVMKWGSGATTVIAVQP